MKLAELPFIGFQGEGKNQGKLSLFIRFSDCNLRCSFCDSKHTWEDKLEYTFDDIIEKCNNVTNIVFTGGEPLLVHNKKEIINIINYFKESKTYEIETNGTILLNNSDIIIFNKYNVLCNISPKSSTFKISKNLKDLTNYVIKFLFKNEQELITINELTNHFNYDRTKIYVQPYGIESLKLKTIILTCYNLIIKFNFNLSIRSHIFIFENKKGV